jgi:hypothetical protein
MLNNGRLFGISSWGDHRMRPVLSRLGANDDAFLAMNTALTISGDMKIICHDLYSQISWSLAS